jgi:hypothetical protein
MEKSTLKRKAETVFGGRNAHRNFSLIVPVLFGLWSVYLGPDSNWDLRNYHFYNPFAFLNQKLATDFAPGGFQTYFNPLLDIPYYLAVRELPPRMAAFMMGLFQGFNFVLLLGICRYVLARLLPDKSPSIAIFLAAAGCLTANFLSEFGSSMGDNATAIFFLASLLFVFRSDHADRQGGSRSNGFLLLAGLAMGMGVGLKLTNAPYAIALCAALLAFRGPIATKCIGMLIFGMGVLAGMGLTAGYWFHTMWQTFGNPLFPQFGNFFPNPLAGTLGVADKSWLPKSLWEYLTWPLVISANSRRAGQIAIHQIVWAVVYILFIVKFAAGILLRRTVIAPRTMDPCSRYVITVVGVGFIVWMSLFGVYRYLVPIELLAPLVIFLLLHSLLPHGLAMRASAWTIGLSTLVVLFGGVLNWGHSSWSERMLNVEVPPLPAPEKSTVLITEGNPPWSWLALSYPVETAFAQINGNFPQGPAYAEKIRGMLRQRHGQTYALFQFHYDTDYVSFQRREEKVQNILTRFGFNQSTQRCEKLRKLINTLHLRAEVKFFAEVQNGIACKATLLPTREKRDMAEENQAERHNAQTALGRFGLAITEDKCPQYRAGIGDSFEIYQLCKVGSAAPE